MWATDFLRGAACAAAVAAAAGSVSAQPAITDLDIQRAREANRMPLEDELRRVPAPAAPRVDKLPAPAARTTPDLEALSRRFDTSFPGTSIRAASGPALLVFISFSVPQKTLERLAEQASRSQATLVLRGLVEGSLTRTAARVHGLLGTRGAAVQIDPQAFDRYAVTVTPSFVLVRGGAVRPTCNANACAPADTHALVSGDVSIDYALRHIERTAPRFANDARTILQRLAR